MIGKPAKRKPAEAARRSPGRCRRRRPCTTTGRFCSAPKSSVVAVCCTPASITPPSPAMAADSANTCILVTVRLSPRVAHAAGLSFMPCSRRPNGPNRRNTTPGADDAEHDGEEDHVAGVVGEVERPEVEPLDGLRTRPDERPLLEDDLLDEVGEGQRRQGEVDARAGAAPGSATRAPTRPATTTASSRPSGDPSAPHLAMVNAPMPAKLICGQRDLAAVAGQGHQRQHDDRHRRGLGSSRSTSPGPMNRRHDGDRRRSGRRSP